MANYTINTNVSSGGVISTNVVASGAIITSNLITGVPGVTDYNQLTNKPTIPTVTGTNTGDETTATIKSKLGVTTLSGSNTGDQTITLTGDVTGSGTGSFATAIGTGVIVNADVNATANIDASKLGTGVVSTTELNYLDGVTSPIQTQLAAKQNTVALTTTGTSGAATFNSTTGALNIPNYATGSGSGTVTSTSVVSANGLAGSVATATTTPAITLSTTVSGIVKGNGTALSAATAGTDYVIPSGSITGSAGTITGSITESQVTNLTTDLSGKQATLVSGTSIKTINSQSLLGAGDIVISGGGGSGDMLLGTSQTVTANKTFNKGTLLDKGEIVFDVKAYGATGNGTTDDTVAIQSAVDAAGTAGGGTVWFPAGSYKLSTNPIKLYSGTTPTIVAYSNIRLAGSGSSGTNGTLINQTTTGVDAIKALNDGANGAQSVGISIENICVQFTGTATNSGNGIYLAQQSAGGPAYYQWTIKNVRANNFQGTNKAGFNFESLITSTVEACHAYQCATGFFFNGAIFGAYSAVSTSVTLVSCYANSPVTTGYRMINATYMSFQNCACDIEANVTGNAYSIEGCNSVALYTCGVELDGTHTLANGFYIGADAATTPSLGVGLYNCYVYQSKSTKEVYITGASKGVTMFGYQSNSSISGSTALVMDANTSVMESMGNLDAGVAVVRTLNATAIDIILGDSDGYGAVAGMKSLSLSAANIITDTTTGTKIGTATTQKLGFFNATPVVQQTATTDPHVALSNLGLVAAGTAWTMTTSGSVTFTGSASIGTGGYKSATTTITGAATFTSSTRLYTLASAATAAFAVTLPAASAAPGNVYTVKKIDSTANAVTITRAGTDTIDGATTYALASQYKYVTIVSDGVSSWSVVGNN